MIVIEYTVIHSKRVAIPLKYLQWNSAPSAGYGEQDSGILKKESCFKAVECFDCCLWQPLYKHSKHTCSQGQFFFC